MKERGDIMKKIIPFKKDIIFKTNLSEITSISLEHNLQTTIDNVVAGEFLISGEYKLADTSVNVEQFNFNLPFEVSLDERYLIDNLVIDIDDFYYEIINNNMLSVNIEVCLDKLEERPLIDKKIEKNEELNLNFEKNIKEESNSIRNEVVDMEETSLANDVEEATISRSIFDNFDASLETYTTYKIYIIREGDTIDSLLQNYQITKEELDRYNDLNELNIGDKIIIPAVNEKI